MNEIIGELSNIEESTSGIIEAANAKKKELAAQMDQKLRTEMQNTISKNLAEQKAKSEAELKNIEDVFKKKKDSYIDKLFTQMTKE